MKKLLLIPLFLIPLLLQAEKNTLYISTTPNRYIWDSGIGLAYERQFHDLGAYIAFTKGKYSFADNTALNSTKTSVGLTLAVCPHQDYHPLFAGGINYSTFTNYPNTIPNIGFDLGFGAKINHFAVIVTYDFIHNQSQINLGYNF